jgi:hypothetical protein
VNECGYCYSIPFCGEGGGRASKKETNLMFIFITAGQKRNIYSTQIEKVFFYFSMNNNNLLTKKLAVESTR